MTLEEIFKTFQSAHEGGSGSGASYYAVAATCGRRANLIEQYKQIPQEAEESEGNALVIGIAYHLFHQLGAAKEIPEDLVLDMTDNHITADFLEGLRLYKGWQSLWGTLEEKYGEVVGCEIPVEAAPEQFNGPYTGRLDAVVNIHSPEAVNVKTGLNLTEPGIYIIDHKTAKGKSDAHVWQYTQGIQGRGYLSMYPEAKGIIFDVLHKVQVFRHKPEMTKDGKVRAGVSYSHYLQTRQSDDEQVVRALVTLGRRNAQENIANPSACLSGWAPCPFFKNGKCGGY